MKFMRSCQIPAPVRVQSWQKKWRSGLSSCTAQCLPLRPASHTSADEPKQIHQKFHATWRRQWADTVLDAKKLGAGLPIMIIDQGTASYSFSLEGSKLIQGSLYMPSCCFSACQASSYRVFFHKAYLVLLAEVSWEKGTILTRDAENWKIFNIQNRYCPFSCSGWNDLPEGRCNGIDDREL